MPEQNTSPPSMVEAVSHHQAGRLQTAEALYVATLRDNPQASDALHLLGVIRVTQGHLDQAQELIDRAIHQNDGIASYHNSLGAVLRQRNEPDAARAAFRDALAIDPGFANAWWNLFHLHQTLGQGVQARKALQRLVQSHPDDGDAHRRLGVLSYENGNLKAALFHFGLAAKHIPNVTDVWLQTGLIALEFGDESRALACFKQARDVHFANPTLRKRTVRTKLDHDIEQLKWLASHDLIAPSATEALQAHQTLRQAMSPTDQVVGRAFPAHLQAISKNWYNQPLIFRDTPRLPDGSISSDFDAHALNKMYNATLPGIAYGDNLLRPEALHALRHFCLGSTIWTDARYNGGYVGAALTSGFANGLLLQIAQDLRARLPALLGKHPLCQMWAYKYDPQLQGITPHADCAAINVNFWITPDEANLDPTGGGLVVYRKEAPLDWDFQTFNRQPDKLISWTKQTSCEEIRIPHRQNRAVIFNSNLVHKTDTLHFRPGYENRRINITMLFGKRGDHDTGAQQPASR